MMPRVSDDTGFPNQVARKDENKQMYLELIFSNFNCFQLPQQTQATHPSGSISNQHTHKTPEKSVVHTHTRMQLQIHPHAVVGVLYRK